MTATERLRLYRRAAYVAEALVEIEDTLAAHPADTAWLERADPVTQDATIARLEGVDLNAKAVEMRVALFPLAGGAR